MQTMYSMDALSLGLVAGGLLLLVTASLVLTATDLANKRVQTHSSWSQIDVQLNRRYDLVPNLVEAVKGYAAHERETFERVTQALGVAIQAEGVVKQAQAETALTGALERLFAVAAAYPELKANQSFIQLQADLIGAQNGISFARQHYNDVVALYNAARQRAPSNMVASWFHFKPVELFAPEPTEAEAIRPSSGVRF